MGHGQAGRVVEMVPRLICIVKVGGSMPSSSISVESSFYGSILFASDTAVQLLRGFHHR